MQTPDSWTDERASAVEAARRLFLDDTNVYGCAEARGTAE
jgi:hypothetical protein